MHNRSRLFFAVIIVFTFSFLTLQAQVWQSEQTTGSYKNPVIWADYSDPDIIRVGSDFYLTASSFNCVPALPILYSTDLINWRIINHAIKRFPDPYFDIPQHGNGVWAPSIRFHKGWFYIYWGDPDRGIYMVRTQDPQGEWSAPVLVKKAYGNIDPCPLWDDDGRIYLVHAFANSRAGISHVLQLQELTTDGSAVTKSRDIIIKGLPDNHTLEGPKIYKHNGWYYIFAPAGGVARGWQMVYRSRDIWGPYEGRRVLEQGHTTVNGPHQGGWIELAGGENWFLHFQELQPFGRIVHLQPLKWIADWPVMGLDNDGDGREEPVMEFSKPETGNTSSIILPQASDEFNDTSYNLAWQWQANWYPHWFSLSDNPGHLRLYARYHHNPASLWMVPNIIAQKIPGPQFTAITKIDGSQLKENEKAGLVIMGLDYAALTLSPISQGYTLELAVCKDAHKGFSEQVKESVTLKTAHVFFKVFMDKEGQCRFAYSINGQNYTDIGEIFQAREGRWIGARIGLFALSGQETGLKGFADFDWFRVK